MREPSATGDDWIDARVSLLRQIAAAFFLILMAVTWPLWIPQHAFPQVPMFRWLGRLPDGAQWVASAGLVAALTAAMTIPGRSRRAAAASAGVAAAMAALVMAFDQHRWQAWAYHLTLCLTAISLLPAASAAFWLRWLTISIYAYSAWSKCDATFNSTLGPLFVNALAKVLHIPENGWFDSVRWILADALPTGELLIAIALAWPFSRRFGLIGAILFHIMVILALGPWGLNHRWGVLAWNAYFMLQDPLLMLGPLRRELAGATPSASRPAGGVRGLLGRGVMTLALVAPLGEPWGYCDHWMAWSLYAPRVERIEIYLRNRDAAGWPPAIRPFLFPDFRDPGVRFLRSDLWSLDDCFAPLVPQRRVQLAVAAWVADQMPPDAAICVRRFEVADRWTGRRERPDDLTSRQEILDAAGKFWLNALPRETNHRRP